ncbi:MAG: hypothetical protein KKD64_07335 [Alphaproteobacteria bacterium]|nr:hypothetical protein [Alphaproteobacteria bacterium]MBU0793707.1 hypothetical protein [Alphaproteobacteria bacterium]MBU0876431.1 hypothetical protein [Alphaproteobacteria bacterium]MBU1769450.1 hypothetical protein [Alphaproteobacteria bacterium]
MKKYVLAAGFPALIFAACVPFTSTALAKQRTVIEQLPPEIVDKNYVDQVEVIVADTAREKMAKLEEKAAEKRAEAKLAAWTQVADSAAPPAEEYATIPFTAMMPFVMRDVTRKWGLTPERGGSAVNLRITIENVKTANAGMALLIGSSDELSGEVVVLDSATQQQIGNFYVQVINSHGGIAGLAMRGGGIREKLVEEFALESSRILTGSTKKDWKKRVKADRKAAEEEAKSSSTTVSAI